MTEQERLDLIRKNQRIARESGSMYQTEEIDGVEYRVDDDNNYFNMTTGELVNPYYPSQTPTRKDTSWARGHNPYNPQTPSESTIMRPDGGWKNARKGKGVSYDIPMGTVKQVGDNTEQNPITGNYWPPSKSSTPRYTFWDDEPSEEVLTQLRAMKAIKGGNDLIDKYNSLNNLSVPLSGYKGRTLEGAPGDLRFGQQDLNKFWKGKDDYITKRGNSVPSFSSMQGLEVNNDSNPTGLVPVESYYGNDAIQRAQKDMGLGFNSEDTIRNNLRFDLGKGDSPKDKTDWLGWAGIGTGLLQGAGGILDYFSNMKGLELTKEAMDKKYAADDRNYLAQATALNNVIDTRKDFINKTQGGRNTDFLKNIPV